MGQDSGVGVEASPSWVHRDTSLILFSLSYEAQPSFMATLRALAEILNLCISVLPLYYECEWQ